MEKTKNAIIKKTITVYFKDGRILTINPEQAGDFQVMPEGFIFIVYKPLIAIDKKEQLDITFEKRWYRLDEIKEIEETRTERRINSRSIFEFKRDNAEYLSQCIKLKKGDQGQEVPEPRTYD